MGDKKYLLIILSLFFIKFLNLNATVLLKDNSRQLFPYKGVAELNLTYKYVENGKFTEIYDEDGKLIYIDKSYILEPEVKASTMKVKITERESDGKKIPIVEKYYPSGNLYSITMYELKDKDEDIEKNDIKKFYTSGKLEKDIYIYIYSEVCYESGKLKIRKMQRENKSKVETYYENGKLFEKTTMKDGKPDGKYEVYDPDGKLEESVFYKNGEVVNK